MGLNNATSNKFFPVSVIVKRFLEATNKNIDYLVDQIQFRESPHPDFMFEVVYRVFDENADKPRQVRVYLDDSFNISFSKGFSLIEGYVGLGKKVVGDADNNNRRYLEALDTFLTDLVNLGDLSGISFSSVTAPGDFTLTYSTKGVREREDGSIDLVFDAKYGYAY